MFATNMRGEIIRKCDGYYKRVNKSGDGRPEAEVCTSLNKVEHKNQIYIAAQYSYQQLILYLTNEVLNIPLSSFSGY